MMRRDLLCAFERSRRAVPMLFALALACRIVPMLACPQAPVSDAAFYVDRARDMAQGLGYRTDGYWTAFWPVGYPALLAASMTVFGPSLLGPMIVNLASAMAIMALMLWFARALGLGGLAMRIALLLYALYPAHIVYTGIALSETASTAVTMAAFALLVAGRRDARLLVASGLVFGAATLMRAQILFLPAGLLIALMLVFRDFSWRRAARAALIVHLAMAAVILPWSLRNEQRLGSFILVSTNGGVALYTGANDQATGDFFAWEQGPLWDRIGIPFRQHNQRQVEIDHRLKALSLAWIKAHSVRYATLGVRKMVLLWRKDSDAFWSLEENYPQHDRALMVVQVINQLYYLALLALGAIGLGFAARALMRRDHTSAPIALLGCMPVFVTLTAYVFTGQVRYHYPAMPFVMLAAAWTLARWRDGRTPQAGHGSCMAAPDREG